MAITDYDILEYIESTTSSKGSFCIQIPDVTVNVQSGRVIYLDYKLTTASWGDSASTQYWGGLISVKDQDCRIIYLNGASLMKNYWNGPSTTYDTTAYNNTDRHRVTIFDSNIYFDGGNSYGKFRSSGGAVTGLSIFAQKYDNTEYSILARFYGMAQFQLIPRSCDYYLYPARRKSDNKIGIYNSINDTFYTNVGTGIFTAGPVTNFNLKNVVNLSVNNINYTKLASGGTTLWEAPPFVFVGGKAPISKSTRAYYYTGSGSTLTKSSGTLPSTSYGTQYLTNLTIPIKVLNYIGSYGMSSSSTVTVTVNNVIYVVFNDGTYKSAGSTAQSVKTSSTQSEIVVSKAEIQAHGKYTIAINIGRSGASGTVPDTSPNNSSLIVIPLMEV